MGNITNPKKTNGKYNKPEEKIIENITNPKKITGEYNNS